MYFTASADPDVVGLLGDVDHALKYRHAHGAAEYVRMDGRIDPGRALFIFTRVIEPVLEYLQHDARRVAVAHIERQVVAFHVARERHHRAGLEMHEVRQVVVQGIPVPLEPLLRQQAAGPRAWRAARADPSGRALAGYAHDQVDGAPDIGPLLVLVEIDRD